MRRPTLTGGPTAGTLSSASLNGRSTTGRRADCWKPTMTSTKAARRIPATVCLRPYRPDRACCSSTTQAGDWSGRRAISSIMRTTSSARYTEIPTNWASIISARTTQGWWKRRGSAAGCLPPTTGAVSSPPGRNSSGRTSCGDASPPWSATCPPTSPDTGRC